MFDERSSKTGLMDVDGSSWDLFPMMMIYIYIYNIKSYIQINCTDTCAFRMQTLSQSQCCAGLKVPKWGPGAFSRATRASSMAIFWKGKCVMQAQLPKRGSKTREIRR